MTFTKIVTIVLLSIAGLTVAAPEAKAADSGAMKACLARAQAVRAGAIANGTPRAVADRIWAAAVKSCKKQYASVPNSIVVAQIQVPEGCRLVVGTDVFECPDRPVVRTSVLAQWMDARYKPPGNLGAPKGTAGAGTRLKEEVALSIPRDRGDDAPKTSPKSDPKAPIKLIG